MTYQIAVDTGGTFTDIALSYDGADPVIGKSLTTHPRIFDGVEAAIANAAQQFNSTAEEVIRNTSIFIYGTTHATNAIVTGSTAKTALLCTSGFSDVLILREGGKRSAFDFRTEYPPPYIPKQLTFEISERISAEGDILKALDESQVATVLKEAAHRGVEAIGVCLLWSVVNPSHEEVVGRLIEEHMPGVPFTLSHRLNPIVREYRRASSVAIDSSLKPLMQSHLSQLRLDLADRGFLGSLLTVTSLGGAMHVEDLVERPIYAVRSGPAMAPVAATVYNAIEKSTSDLIVCDTGGTTFDVSLVRGGLIKETRETWLGGRFVGNITGMASVDVQSIGSGGGSIAWVDSGGMLRVGPRSAGSNPGPACYGRGGTEPTVTDAALVLGYLDHHYFLGGRMSLDLKAARRAIESVGLQLAMTTERAAYAIYKLATEAMVGAIREITIEEGIDPRECRIVAGGGAAGLNAASMASELGVSEVLIPRTAGALSACGGLYADVMTEVSATFYADTAAFPRDEVNNVLDGLERTLNVMSETLKNRGIKDLRIEYRLEARYPSQTWEIEVPLPVSRFRAESDVDQLLEAFHDAHERIFAVREPGQKIECLFWRARLVGSLNERPAASDAKHYRGTPEPRVTYPSFFGGETVDTKRYEGRELRPGTQVSGPAIVDENTTTIVIPPGSVLTATDYNYIVEVSSHA